MRTQLHHLLEEGAVRFGDRPALSHQEVTLDYASAWDLASRTGAVLSGLGLARGDRVAVYLDKRIETVGGDLRRLGRRAACSCRSTRCSRRSRWPTSSTTAACGCSSRRAERLRAAARRSCRGLPRARARAARRRRAGRGRRRGRLRVHAWRRFLARRGRRRRAATGDRRRHGGDPLHLGQHRQAEGRRAVAPQPAGRRARASPVPRQRRRRRHPGRAAAELRRRASASSRPAFTVGAHVVLVNYLLARDVVRLCAQAPGHRPHLRAAAVDPARRRRTGRPRRRAVLRYFANTGGRMPRATLDRLRAIFPQAKPVPDVRPDRGVPLDLPRPGRGRPPPRLDRQGDPERRDPRRAPRRHAAASPARRASWSTAARSSRMGYWNDPARTAERFKPAPGPRRRHGARPSSRSGRATASWPTRRASSTSSAAPTR